MDKAYVAAPIFNKDQLAVVSAIVMMLKLQEWKYFSPYEASQSIWRGRAPKDCSPAERDAVLQGNIDNLTWADTLIAWVGGTEDGKTDTGVVWEMGHFNALGRYQCLDSPVIKPRKFTLAYVHPTDKRQHMNLMLAGTVTAVAYGPAQLHDALKMLRESSSKEVREKYHPEKNMMHEKEAIV